MINWVEMGRRTLDMLACEAWQDIARRYGLYRDLKKEWKGGY